ncbi:hypothetical protein SAMN02745111_00703 [Eubacterium uniforme]|uniref:Uncharacterized protein n=1 Tax=Eubacterium uniforme TaxID=39495 RepID=A0A1T4VCU7_9FIRM|nr:hypothetical protein SAMN02745111_00703 [Eubacterium uniforme]
MPKMPEGSFAKKLYSLYLSYLPADKFKYVLKMNVDNRGSFAELVHTEDYGQVSINSGISYSNASGVGSNEEKGNFQINLSFDYLLTIF